MLDLLSRLKLSNCYALRKVTESVIPVAPPRFAGLKEDAIIPQHSARASQLAAQDSVSLSQCLPILCCLFV